MLRNAGFNHLIIRMADELNRDDVKRHRDAGADLVLEDPLSVYTIQSLLEFIKDWGPESHSDSTIVMNERSEKYVWIPKLN